MRAWVLMPAVALLWGCSSFGIGNGAALTPREQLETLEVSYTAAANTANQNIGLIPLAARAQVASVYKIAGDALNVLDTDVLAIPPSGTATPTFTADLVTAQSALTALTAILTQYGVK